jgi:hypothetical protein
MGRYAACRGWLGFTMAPIQTWAHRRQTNQSTRHPS